MNLKLKKRRKINIRHNFTEVTLDYEQLNKIKAIWMQKLEQITKEGFTAFYKSISNDQEDHLTVEYFSFEGPLEFRAVLFCPHRS